jgi:hypothetical protein
MVVQDPPSRAASGPRTGAPGFHAAALASGLLASVCVTFPLVLHPTDHLPGASLAGGCSHAWRAWWAWIAVGVRHVNPAWTDLLNFPVGFPVGFHLGSVMDGTSVIPITWALGPVAGMVAWCIASCTAATWAAAWLGRRTGLPGPVAVVAGLTWSFAPHHLGFLMGGAYENLASPFLPLLLSFLLSLLQPDPEAGILRPAGRAAAVAGCLSGLSLTVWFSGLVVAFLAGFVVLAILLVRGRTVLAGAAWALGGLAAGAALTLAAARVLLPDVNPPLGPLILESAPVGCLWRAWLHDLPARMVLPSPRLWLNQHVLLVMAVLAGLGGCRRQGRPWLLLAVPFLLDAALPDAWLGGSVRVPGALDSARPILHMLLGGGERRLFPLQLALALAAGHGVAWILERMRAGPRATLAAAGLFLAVWVAEQRLLGPVPLPVPSFEARAGAWAAEVATGPPGAVLDVPILVESERVPAWAVKAVNSGYMLDQTGHGRPILAATGSRFAAEASRLPVQDPLVTALLPFGDGVVRNLVGGIGQPPPTPARPGPWSALTEGWTPDRLLAAGYRWVVLHPGILDPADTAFLTGALTDLLGAPVPAADGTLLFRIAGS